MTSDVIYELDGIQVVWSQQHAVYEVWETDCGWPGRLSLGLRSRHTG